MLVFFAAAAVVTALDRVCKFLVAEKIVLGESKAVIDGLLWITHVRNTGAAFNILNEQNELLQWISGILTIGVIVAVLILGKNFSKFQKFNLGLLLGGGVGNFIDRISFGYVVDFIDIKILPVFNVADIAITLSCIFIVIDVLFISRLSEKKKEKAEALDAKLLAAQKEAADKYCEDARKKGKEGKS